MPADLTAPTRRVRFPTAPAHPPGQFQLRVLDTPEREPFILSTPRATVGRSHRADIVVDHPSVSAIHFELRALDRGVEVRDLDSTNKLWFGGREVSSIVLDANDHFCAGSCRFVLDQVTTRSLELVSTDKYGWLYGASVAMRELYTEIEAIGPMPASVVVLGETGTGKELTAKTLHAVSGRRGEMLVLNCGTLSPTLADAKLFGVRKGAFTGAERDQIGLFEAADQGTLFLDEIGELPPALQTKLLRVLEDGLITRVGETKPSAKVDVRVIAATNRDLREAIEAGRFGEDLYHRLAQAVLLLPRLRDRGNDITLLARHFLDEFGRARGMSIDFSDEALAALTRYPWPGNVRELRNVILQAAYRQRGGEVERKNLRFGAHVPRPGGRVEKMLDAGASYDAIHGAVDEMLVSRHFERYGTVSGVARAMGTSRDLARKLLLRFGLTTKA